MRFINFCKNSVLLLGFLGMAFYLPSQLEAKSELKSKKETSENKYQSSSKTSSKKTDQVSIQTTSDKNPISTSISAPVATINTKVNGDFQITKIPTPVIPIIPDNPEISILSGDDFRVPYIPPVPRFPVPPVNVPGDNPPPADEPTPEFPNPSWVYFSYPGDSYQFDVAHDTTRDEFLVASEADHENGGRKIKLQIFNNQGEVVNGRELSISELLPTSAPLTELFNHFGLDPNDRGNPEMHMNWNTQCSSYFDPNVVYNRREGNGVYYVSWTALCTGTVKWPMNDAHTVWNDDARGYDINALEARSCDFDFENRDNLPGNCRLAEVGNYTFTTIFGAKLSAQNLDLLTLRESSPNNVAVMSSVNLVQFPTVQNLRELRDIPRSLLKVSSSTNSNLASDHSGNVLLTYQTNSKGILCYQLFDQDYTRTDVISTIEAKVFRENIEPGVFTVFRTWGVTLSDEEERVIGRTFANDDDGCRALFQARENQPIIKNAYNPYARVNAGGSGFDIVFTVEDGTLDDLQDFTGANKRINVKRIQVDSRDAGNPPVVFFTDQDNDTNEYTLVGLPNPNFEEIVRPEDQEGGPRRFYRAGLHSEPYLDFDQITGFHFLAYDDASGSHVAVFQDRYGRSFDRVPVLASMDDPLNFDAQRIRSGFMVLGNLYERENQLSFPVENLAGGFSPKLKIARINQVTNEINEIVPATKVAVSFTYDLPNGQAIAQNFIDIEKVGGQSFEGIYASAHNAWLEKDAANPSEVSAGEDGVYASSPQKVNGEIDNRFLTFYNTGEEVIAVFVDERDVEVEVGCEEDPNNPGFEEGDACVVSQNGCMGAGELRCLPGNQVLECVGEVETSEEVCDGIDNDCDGIVDNVEGVGTICSAGEGDCRVEGTMQCINNDLSCDAQPGNPNASEICNGVDDNCDGLVDEADPDFIDDLLGQPCSDGSGACQVSGSYNACNGGTNTCSVAGQGRDESPEVCNGEDDDCNGEIDDIFGECPVGMGQCRRDGNLVCIEGPDGQLVAACNVVAGNPEVEICNGIDDDCDGRTDEYDGLGATPDDANIIDFDGDGFGEICDGEGQRCSRPQDGGQPAIGSCYDNCPNEPNPDQYNSDGFEEVGPEILGDACDPDDDNDGVLDPQDNCRVIPNENQSDIDEDGDGDLCDNDRDGDGVNNDIDNCPDNANEDQRDLPDGDGLGNVCDSDDDNDGVNDNEDNCPEFSNADSQGPLFDIDGDGAGDACDPDRDGDDIPNDIDNCPNDQNPDQVDLDEDGLGDECDPDDDGDGVPDVDDNCPGTPNPNQNDVCSNDRDGDGVDDYDDEDNQIDNCLGVANPNQIDLDNDGEGNACDLDDDGDGVNDDVDNCPLLANPNTQGEAFDPDQDGRGNDCDLDDDGDGVDDVDDNCPLNANADQRDLPDRDGLGNVCDSDDDNDGVNDNEDNCPRIPNADQVDTNLDLQGDACDNDDDGDGVLDGDDNCPLNENPNQSDTDGDDIGDVCDPDRDGDGRNNDNDNCPDDANADQADNEGDGLGDVCDPNDDNDAFPDGGDNCPLIANNDQADFDIDGEGDACDNDIDNDGIDNDEDLCDNVSNLNNNDNDGDLLGDVCDPDDDNDGVGDLQDNCPFDENNDQVNSDAGLPNADGLGDVCDPDDDNDGILDGDDNCSIIPNPDQENLDGDEFGDVCDDDLDGDGLNNGVDNCPDIANPGQENLDGDNLGDICDDDRDGDGLNNEVDNCPDIANPDQLDLPDGDGLGNLCDPDIDDDGVLNGDDNCPALANADQLDAPDADGIGNVCDSDDDDDGVLDGEDNCPDISNPGQENLDGDNFGDVCDDDRDGDGFDNDGDNCPDIANADQLNTDGDGFGDACDICPRNRLNDGDGDGVCDIDFSLGFTAFNGISIRGGVGIGDFNRDGFQDLAVHDRNGQSISVYISNNGSFGEPLPPISIRSPGYANVFSLDISVGYFNDDDFLDIITLNNNQNTVSILLNQQDGLGNFVGFSQPTYFDLRSSPFSLRVGNLDGDDIDDIIYVSFGSNEIGVLLSSLANGQNGEFFPNNFQYFSLNGLGPYEASVGDSDNDGDLDILVINYTDGSVSILENIINNNLVDDFIIMQPIDIGRNPADIFTKDINGDLIPEIFTADNRLDAVGLLYSIGANSYDLPGNLFHVEGLVDVELGNRYITESVFVDDINNDDLDDIITMNTFSNVDYDNREIRFLLNNNGNFISTNAVIRDTGDGIGSKVSAVDLDLDGDKDLIMSSSAGIKIFYNQIIQ